MDSYNLSLVLIAGLECYSVSCSVSINCNLIVPLLRNPLIFERIATGRCFPFFFYFPSSISFSPSLVLSECLIIVFVPCCHFFSVNIFNFLFTSHSHLFFWILSYLISVKSIWNQIGHCLLFLVLLCSSEHAISQKLKTTFAFWLWHVGCTGYWLILTNVVNLALLGKSQHSILKLASFNVCSYIHILYSNGNDSKKVDSKKVLAFRYSQGWTWTVMLHFLVRKSF